MFSAVIYYENVIGRAWLYSMKRILIVLLMLAFFCTACDDIGGMSSVSETSDTSSAVSETSEISLDMSSDTSDENSDTDLDIIIPVLDLKGLEKTYSYSLTLTEGLREKFDSYFGLTTSKGIECYVWLDNGQLVFGLMSGTNRLKTEDEINALLPATLGDIRLILNQYTFLQLRDTVIVFEREPELAQYERELEYLLGIGKYGIEYTVSFDGGEKRVCWNDSAWELYDYLSDLRHNANGEQTSVLRTENCIDISFRTSGSEYLGQYLGYRGSYRIYDSNSCDYSDSLASSTLLTYHFPHDAYTRIHSIIDDAQYPKEYKPPIEPKCFVSYGNNESALVLVGEAALSLYGIISERMENAVEPTEDQMKAHYGMKVEDNTTPPYQGLNVGFYLEQGSPHYVIYPDGFVVSSSIYSSSCRYSMISDDTFDEIVKLSGITLD